MAYFLCTAAIIALSINIWSFLRTGLSPVVVAAASTIAILITSVELLLISKFIGF